MSATGTNPNRITIQSAGGGNSAALTVAAASGGALTVLHLSATTVNGSVSNGIYADLPANGYRIALNKVVSPVAVPSPSWLPTATA